MKGLIAQSGNGFLPGHFSFPNVFKTVVMNIITVKNVRDVIVIIPRCIKNDMSRMYSSLQLLSRLLIAPSQCLQSLEQCA
nr:MAG TPA: hypothetical protein [Caudoviricetes sp.]